MQNPSRRTLARQRAVSACLKKFDGRPQAFGKADCVKLTALALRKQGVAVPLLRGVQYRSLTGAVRALEATGCCDLIAAVDALGLARLEGEPGEPAPARTWAGDVIAMPVPDEDPFGASLMVVHTAGARRVIGFDGEGVIRVVEPDLNLCIAAWRVSGG
jgi:hypothetical protein